MVMPGAAEVRGSRTAVWHRRKSAEAGAISDSQVLDPRAYGNRRKADAPRVLLAGGVAGRMLG